MHPLDFIIAFFSFVYALALTHLLLAVGGILRRRKTVVFSAAHALWMLDALLFLIANWLSLWDFHSVENMPLGTIAVGFAYCVMQYLICALVSADFKGDAIDLRRLQAEQGPTYVTAFFVLTTFTVLTNIAAASTMGLGRWAGENAVVLRMVPVTGAAVLFRSQWIQILTGLAMMALAISYMALYYPALK